ncbi:MAG: substrate-binding domain-containing protein, partial [Pseudomonadota bacterium]
TGFDDIDLADATAPGLTTVHIPHRRMGRGIADALLALCNGRGAEPSTQYETWIAERGSLGPPPVG